MHDQLGRGPRHHIGGVEMGIADNEVAGGGGQSEPVGAVGGQQEQDVPVGALAAVAQVQADVLAERADAVGLGRGLGEHRDGGQVDGGQVATDLHPWPAGEGAVRAGLRLVHLLAALGHAPTIGAPRHPKTVGRRRGRLGRGNQASTVSSSAAAAARSRPGGTKRYPTLRTVPISASCSGPSLARSRRT